LCVRFRQSSAPSAVAVPTVSSNPPLRSTAPRGRGEAGITDDNRRSVPAGVNGRGCAASLRGPVAAARYATEVCSITTVARIFGDLVLSRAELCSRMTVQILFARLHVRRQLSCRVGNYLNGRLVHVRCHLTSRPLMTPRDVIASPLGFYLILAYSVRT
jgi:hypothetical protein